MDPLVFHQPAARDLFHALLAAWGAIEVVLRLRTRGGRSARDWTFFVFGGCIAAAFGLAFPAAHVAATSLHGGWGTAIAGSALIAAGVAFRLWAAVKLGRFFKFAVVIQEGHRVIRSGPYRVLRHPLYAGALVALLGIGVALDNWLSIMALLLLPLAGVLVRVPVEESELTAALGDEYRDYAARTYRLVPGVW